MQDIFHLELETEEFVYMIGFNNAMKPLGIFQISHGTVNAFLISPREIFLKALILGCSSLVLCHNHTSLVSTTPSREDIQVTQKIKSAGMVIGIPLIDHLILGENYSYTSLKEEGLL